MAASAADGNSHPGRGQQPLRWRLSWLLCLVLLLLVMPGCRGCRWFWGPSTPEEEAKAKEEAEKREKERKKKKKPDFEVGNLISQPHPRKAKFCLFKPGHWTAASLPAKTNNFDFLGELEIVVEDRPGRPAALPGTDFTIESARPIALPKGQPKVLEAIFFPPATGQVPNIEYRLNTRRGGTAHGRSHVLTKMRYYQYHFVVLARWPDRYGYLRQLDSLGDPQDVKDERAGDVLENLDWPRDPDDLTGQIGGNAYYHLEFLQADRRVALPAHGLYWTSIAYVLWDDAQADALRLEQQVALLDWLHWGGQLILSGPDTLDTLRDSFLASYLPATSAGSRQLTAADLEEINEHWTLPVGNKPRRVLAPLRPWAGVALQKHPDARFVPRTGELLAERRIGRGRIVVSAFRLSGKELTDWPGYDGFFNACVMGRPPRKFQVAADVLNVQATWADGWDLFDPGRVCQLRYFTRDTGRVIRPIGDQEYGGGPYGPGYGGWVPEPLEEREKQNADPGSWNDRNAVANAARDALNLAARIEIPERSFVIWVVAGYLIVLVPANWLVFRAIGRVEWAWAAAPLIAVVCTVVVIRLAQLDIGFARSQTEVAVVELQGQHQRAHVTRYSALYTSLTTSYRIRSDDPGAQMQPFGPAADSEQSRSLRVEGLTELRYDYGQEVSLSGLRIWSNQVDQMHCEQMLDLGGGLSLVQTPEGVTKLVNETGLDMKGVGVLRRDESGRVEAAWVGTLAPGAIAELVFGLEPLTDGRIRFWSDQWELDPIMATAAAPGSLNLRKLANLACKHEELQPGDVRLVGWVEGLLPGIEIRPAAPQAHAAALVVAHLRYGHWRDPQPDEKTRAEAEAEQDPVRTVTDPF